MYCLEFVKYDVSNTSYYTEVENGALLCNVVWLWKMILGGHGKSWKIFREKVWELCTVQINIVHLLGVHNVCPNSLLIVNYQLSVTHCVPHKSTPLNVVKEK